MNKRQEKMSKGKEEKEKSRQDVKRKETKKD